MIYDQNHRGLTNILDDAIDSHVHASPDLAPRSLDIKEAVSQADKAGMGGIMYLNHYFDTTPISIVMDNQFNDIDVRGGIKLNHSVGGLNPAAVETCVKLGGAKIDMPTLDSSNELSARGKNQAKGISILKNGRLKPEVEEILDIISTTETTVVTGHLSIDEIRKLIHKCEEYYITAPVISHPKTPSIDMPIGTQKELVESGALVEYCFANTTELLANQYPNWNGISSKDIFSDAAEIGVDNVILSTDLGQPGNPNPVEGFRQFISDGFDYGFTIPDLEKMVRDNPRKVYGFD